MRIALLTLFNLLILISGITAQKLTYRLGYMLVQVEKGAALQDILADHSSQVRGDILPDKTISERLGIFLVRFDHSRIHQIQLLEQLRQDKRVHTAQFDHLTSLRAVPDDPMFDSQWHWLNTGQSNGLPDADTDADEAWNWTQGGLTPAGDTIVVAIIDSGMDYLHEDIAANAWRNHFEIDSNGIDDDGNGYIDDVYGWNAYDDNGDVWGQGHGLNVAGMVGAVGNNQIGITGINWNVKMMIIVGGSPESSVLASYAYALEQRILYNETQGARGAFVVATNSSWGIDFGQPSDAPLWCGFYDILGQHGILSAGATANRNINIDEVGDLPTGCPSEYLLSVTALDASAERTFSAYGLQHVDFGAPGDRVLTTRRNNGYGNSSGTSFASPIAAGLVALLYSAPCPGLGELIHSSPSGAAKFIRDVIFQGVQPVPSLESQVRFGGSLNAGNSMEYLMSLCSECPFPFAVEAHIFSDTEVAITWSQLDTADAINARYRPLNAPFWDTLFDVSQPLFLFDLHGCTEYEIEFEAICADTSSGFLSNHIFKTDGCCELPANLLVVTTEDGAWVTWDFVLAAQSYLIQWRAEGEMDWIEMVVAPTLAFEITNLENCTYYEFRLQTLCDTSETGFSDIILLRTKNCGNCIDLPYCEAISDDSGDEHIDSLIIGPLVNHSGQNGGYIFFEDLNPAFVAGDTYPIWLRPGFDTGTTFDEQFRIWIDINQDGDFSEDELLLDTILLREELILVSSLIIPETALTGTTRMRVSMAFSTPNNPANQNPCGLIDFGEIEDYCIDILRRPDECPLIDTVHFDAITFTSAFMFWPSAEGAIAYTYRWRETGTLEYTEMATVDTIANLIDLMRCKTYEVQIRTVCSSDTTSYNVHYTFNSDCDVAVKEESPLLYAFDVFPNPATDLLIVRLHALEKGNHQVSLFTAQGQRIRQQILYADDQGESQIRFDQLHAYPPGLYFVVVEKGGRVATKKVVKM